MSEGVRLWMLVSAIAQSVILLISCGYAVGSFRALHLGARPAIVCSFAILASSIVTQALLFARTIDLNPIPLSIGAVSVTTLAGSAACYWLSRSIWRALEDLKRHRGRGLDEIEEITKRIFR